MDQGYDGIPDDDIWNIQFSEMNIGNELARGSFGKVYRGEYLGLDVAIKQILRHNDPAYMKYIEREISVLKGIRHPFVVGFIGVCLHETGLYIVTEFIDGGDVRDLIKNSTVDWSRKLQIADDLAKSMAYLHAKKIIHRDLKCKNLLIGTDGRVRLCDFGFARLSDAFQIAPGRTEDRSRAMTICGTPGFVAPEIMLGQEYDHKCDMFSYGNVLAELVTEKRPGREFWKRSAESKYVLDFQQLVDMAPPDTPSGFVELAIKCCAYLPKDRPTFVEILEDLKQMAAALPWRQRGQQRTGMFTAGSHRLSLAQSDELRQTMATAAGAAVANNAGDHQSGNATAAERPYRLAGDVDLGSASNRVDGDLMPHMTGAGNQRNTLTSGEIVVSDKHLVKMLTRATSPDMMDSEYVADLILMYPCFATPAALLGVCMERYSEASTGILACFAEENSEEKSKRYQIIQMRVVVFLNQWIEQYPDDFKASEMAEAIDIFDQTVSGSGGAPFSIKSALAGLDGKRRPTLRHPKPAFLKQDGPRVPLNAKFFVGSSQPASLVTQRAGSRGSLTGVLRRDKEPKAAVPQHVFVSPYTAQSWAQQIALVSQALYRAIKPREFLKESWKILGDSNVRNMVDHASLIGRWTASIIVSLDGLDARLCAVQKFIDIAQHLMSMRDYNSYFGIVAFGLAHPSVERLTQTWANISPSARVTWQSCLKIVDKAENYKNYKDVHADSMPPCVPYMAVFLSELSYVDSFNPDIGKGGIINFSKHRKMAHLIKGLERLGSVNYEFATSPELQQHFLRSLLLEDDHLEKQSMYVEAPKF